MTAVSNNNTIARAMDVYDMVSLVSAAFYAEFDYTDDTYYWVMSIMVDNTLVAEDGLTSKLYKVSFTIDEGNNISFQQKNEWVEVQKEYVPVEGRSFFVSEEYRAQKIAETQKRKLIPGSKESFSRSNNFTVDEENRRFSGYGIVFDSDSEPLVINLNGRKIQVVEQISRSSIEEADMTDVIAAFNHNFEKILARSGSETLSWGIDDTGVSYAFDVPNTSYGNDLLESTRRGDISGSSFTFLIDPSAGYDIQERADGTLLAIPNKITRVIEMGPVVMPAYPQTTAENRGSALANAVEAYIKQRDQKQEPTQVSMEVVKHYKAKLRHNEEAAK